MSHEKQKVKSARFSSLLINLQVVLMAEANRTATVLQHQPHLRKAFQQEGFVHCWEGNVSDSWSSRSGRFILP